MELKEASELRWRRDVRRGGSRDVSVQTMWGPVRAASRGVQPQVPGNGAPPAEAVHGSAAAAFDAAEDDEDVVELEEDRAHHRPAPFVRAAAWLPRSVPPPASHAAHEAIPGSHAPMGLGGGIVPRFPADDLVPPPEARLPGL